MISHNAKKAAAFNMSRGDKTCEGILDELSLKEMKILQKHPDLMEKARGIAKMTLVQILAELKVEFDLEVDTYNSHDMWISTEKLEEAIPGWFQTSHCGWYQSTDNGEFMDWARAFLMQEVRIDIWSKYLEHKKNPKPEVYYGQYV